MVARKGELIDHAIKSPRYIQVYSTVRDWIYQGSYKPGSRLPTEEELCRLFQVSRITTRKAVDMLVDEGLVVRQPGRGTFVVEDLADAPVIGEMDQLLRKVERLGKTSRIAQAEVVEVEADPDTAKDLGLARRARGCRRPPTSGSPTSSPIGYVVTYIPAVAEGALRPQRAQREPDAQPAGAQGRGHRLRRPGDQRHAGRRAAGLASQYHGRRAAGAHPAGRVRQPSAARWSASSPGTAGTTTTTTCT